MDYKHSGVDIEAGYKSVELMKGYVKETMRPEVLADISQRRSAQKRVHDCVQQNIRIRMSQQTKRMRDLHTS